MRGKHTEKDLRSRLPLVVVTGPTAVGKTGLSLRLAHAVGAEVVNADAMQLYRGLDIGTAKPTPEERGSVPHHLFDLWDVRRAASVAQYQRTARRVVADVQSRNAVALVVGGSALYLRALCDQLDIPPQDPAVRARWEERARESGAAALHAELQRRDPEAAAAIDPRNLRRVVRALEVVELTGSFTARMPERVSWRPTVWLGLDRDRAELDDRIRRRAGQMWSGGLLAETEQLLADGLAEGPTARMAVGYRQALAVLAGESTPAEGLADTVRATARLARRQQRAFRTDGRIRWLAGQDPLDEALAILARAGISPAAGSTPSPERR